MTDAWDDEDRAIARALGADVPEPENASSPDIDALVSEYENVLAELPITEVAPRPELEHEMVSAALARRPAAARAIVGGRSRARRSTAPRWIAIGGAVAAAAAVVVALAVGRPTTEPGSPGGRIASAAATGSVAQVLATPGTRTGVLRTTSGDSAGRVALGSDGQGFLYSLPPRLAPRGPPRWLWLDTGADDVLVGQLPESSTVHFVVRGDVDAVTGVFVTTEPEQPVVPGPVTSQATLD